MADNVQQREPLLWLPLSRLYRYLGEHPGTVFSLLYLALVLLLYGGLLWQQENIVSDPQGDLMAQFIAWRSFASDEISAGNFPFWNPYVFGGAPYFGSMQSALLYPPNVLFLALPLVSAINWSVALHTWMMGFFTYLWLHRGRRLAPLAAGYGGVVAMFAAPFFLHIEAGHLPNISTMVWVPLVLLAFDRWSVEGRLRWVVYGAVAVVMQVFAGHPQYLFYTGVTVVLLSIFKCLSGCTSLSRTLIGLVSVYLLGSLLGAVQLLPGLEAAGESVRATGIPFSYAAEFSLPLQGLLTLMAPGAWDIPVQGLPMLWEGNLYFGVAGIALFFLGLNIRRSNDNMAYLLAMGTLFVLALGSHTPLFSWLFHYVPGFDLFRGSAKFAFFVILIAVYFSAYGAERLLSHPASISTFVPGRLLAITVAVAGCALWVAQLAPLGEMSGVIPQPLPAGTTGINPALVAPANTAIALYRAAALLGLAALLIWQAQKKRRLAAWMLMLLAASEVFIFAADHLSDFALKLISESETVKFLNTHHGGDRVLNLALPNAGMLTHNKEIWGSDPGILRRWGEFIAATQKTAVPYSQFVHFNLLPPVLALTRLHWVIQRSHGAWQVTEIPAPLPRVSIYSQVETITDKHLRLQRLAEPRFDFRHTLLLESRAPILPVAGASGKIDIVKEGTDSLELRVHLSAPAYLLITDAYSQGWKVRGVAESRDKDYQLVPADHAFIGIPLTAGTHHLQLYYRPTLWWYGVSLSLLGLVCLLLLWLREKRAS